MSVAHSTLRGDEEMNFVTQLAGIKVGLFVTHRQFIYFQSLDNTSLSSFNSKFFKRRDDFYVF